VSENALLECPFCGCQAWIYCKAVFPGGVLGWRVECEGECHAMTCWWHTKEEAVAAWNRRHSKPEKYARLKCTMCGMLKEVENG